MPGNPHKVTLTRPIVFTECTGFRVARTEETTIRVDWDPSDPRIVRTPWPADDPRIVRTAWPADDPRLGTDEDPGDPLRFDVAPPVEQQIDESPDPSERYDLVPQFERIIAFRPALATADVEVRESELAQIEPPLAGGELAE